MIDILLGALVGLFAGCWIVIFSSLYTYTAKLSGFKRELGKASDCCMCGATDPYQCGNHSYTSQRDWFIDNHKPKFY